MDILKVSLLKCTTASETLVMHRTTFLCLSLVGVMISESQTHQQVGGPGIISTKRQGSGFPVFLPRGV